MPSSQSPSVSSAHFAAHSSEIEPAQTVAPLPAHPSSNEGAPPRETGLRAWLHRLDPPRTVLLTALLAIILTLPALWVGFAQDDYAFLSIFNGGAQSVGLEQPIWNTFTFSEGDPERNRIRMELGILPWWAVQNWKVNFWRPVAGLSHWADFTLFGERPLPMHLHSILLYAVLAAFATIFFFRSLDLRRAAVLAAIIFAVDSAHGVPAGWLANRNAILSGIFAVAALLAHHAWRRRADIEKPWKNWFPFGLLSVLGLVLALLSAEAAVGLGAYYFAYSLCLDPLSRPKMNLRSIARSMVPLLPYLAVVIVWRLTYNALGYGVEGSWLYIDPVAAPLAFLSNIASHTPVLLLSLLGLPDATLWFVLPTFAQVVYTLAASAIVCLTAWYFWPALRHRREARFYALACVLSVLPIAGATLPADRNLMLPSLAAAALIAIAIGSLRPGASTIPPRPAARYVLIVLIVIHLALSPMLLAANSYSIAILHGLSQRLDDTVPQTPDIASRTVITINTPIDLLAAGLPFLRMRSESVAPAHWWWLYAGVESVEVRRLDEKTLVIHAEGGFLTKPWAQIFRRPEAHPMAIGQTVTLSRMTARIQALTPDGRPSAVRFNFDRPLEDESFLWLAWSEDGYTPFELPAVGESSVVRGLQRSDLWRLITADRNADGD